MNSIIIILCCLLAAFFHQGLYILIPFLTLYYISNQKESKLRLNPLTKIYLNVFLVVVGFFLIQSILYFDIAIFAIKGSLRIFAYFLFAVLISYMSKTDIKYAFIVLIGYLLISIPFSFYQMTYNLGKYQNIWDHSNHLAYVLSMCIYFLIFYRPLRSNTATLVCVLGLLLSLVLTKSTGGLLVLIALLVYNAVVTKRISFGKKITFFVLSLLGLFAAINFSDKIAYQVQSISYLTPDFIMERVDNYIVDGVTRAGGYGSVVWRIIYWSKLLVTFFGESWIKITLGLGVDHLTKGFMPYYFMDKDPHNDFIKVLMEFGITGLLLFFYFFKKIYDVLGRNFNIIILMIVPMFFGNAIVNFPFNITLILILMYEYKQSHTNIS